jgi:hypothetical protein
MRKVGSVRLQLYMTREIIAQLDKAQESRMLTNDELAWRRDLKWSCVLAPYYRSCITYLEEGDANMKFFHL